MSERPRPAGDREIAKADLRLSRLAEAVSTSRHAGCFVAIPAKLTNQSKGASFHVPAFTPMVAWQIWPLSSRSVASSMDWLSKPAIFISDSWN